MTLRSFRRIEWAATMLCFTVALGVTLWGLDRPLGDADIPRVLFLWIPLLVVLLVYLTSKIDGLREGKIEALDIPIVMSKASILLVGVGTAIYLSQLPYTFGIDPAGRVFSFTVCSAFLSLALLGVFPDKPERTPRSSLGIWILRHWRWIWAFGLAAVTATSLLVQEPMRVPWFPILANSLVQVLGGRGGKSSLRESSPR